METNSDHQLKSSPACASSSRLLPAKAGKLQAWGIDSYRPITSTQRSSRKHLRSPVDFVCGDSLEGCGDEA